MKELSQTESDVVQSQIDAIDRNMPDSVHRRRIRQAVDRVRDKLVADLSGIMALVRGNQQTVDEAIVKAREHMIDAFSMAASRGHMAAGAVDWKMTNNQVDAIALLVEEELVFFRRFMTSVAGEAMKPDQRVGLYGGGVDSAFWRGWLMLLPSNAEIWWRLWVAEHCPDCIKLAAGNPYSKPGRGTQPLPTVPRNGETKCLSNCRCFLEAREGSSWFTVAPEVAIEVTKIGGTRIDPTSPGGVGAADLYQDTVERYAWFRRMDLLLPGGNFGRLATQAMLTLDRMAQQFGHTIRLSANVKEILEPVITALAMGYRFINPEKLDDELLLAIAIVVGMNDADMGKISLVQQNPPQIVIDGEADRVYRLDAVGRGILFVE